MSLRSRFDCFRAQSDGEHPSTPAVRVARGSTIAGTQPPVQSMPGPTVSGGSRIRQYICFLGPHPEAVETPIVVAAELTRPVAPPPIVVPRPARVANPNATLAMLPLEQRRAIYQHLDRTDWHALHALALTSWQFRHEIASDVLLQYDARKVEAANRIVRGISDETLTSDSFAAVAASLTGLFGVLLPSSSERLVHAAVTHPDAAIRVRASTILLEAKADLNPSQCGRLLGVLLAAPSPLPDDTLSTLMLHMDSVLNEPHLSRVVNDTFSASPDVRATLIGKLAHNMSLRGGLPLDGVLNRVSRLPFTQRHEARREICIHLHELEGDAVRRLTADILAEPEPSDLIALCQQAEHLSKVMTDDGSETVLDHVLSRVNDLAHEDLRTEGLAALGIAMIRSGQDDSTMLERQQRVVGAVLLSSDYTLGRVIEGMASATDFSHAPERALLTAAIDRLRLDAPGMSGGMPVEVIGYLGAAVQHAMVHAAIDAPSRGVVEQNRYRDTLRRLNDQPGLAPAVRDTLFEAAFAEVDPERQAWQLEALAGAVACYDADRQRRIVEACLDPAVPFIQQDAALKRLIPSMDDFKDPGLRSLVLAAAKVPDRYGYASESMNLLLGRLPNLTPPERRGVIATLLANGAERLTAEAGLHLGRHMGCVDEGQREALLAAVVTASQSENFLIGKSMQQLLGALGYGMAGMTLDQSNGLIEAIHATWHSGSIGYVLAPLMAIQWRPRSHATAT